MLDSFTTAYRTELVDKKSISLVYPIATETEFFKVAADDTTPVAWPVQSPEHVARSIVKGIIKNKKSIFPSFLFRSMMAANRLLPMIRPLYLRIETYKLNKWAHSRG